MLPQQLCRATQTVVYRVAGAYGFQQFNLDQEHQQWVTATAGVAADQLAGLLRDTALRLLAKSAKDSTPPVRPASLADYTAAWKKAIGDVHGEYFEEYSIWRSNLGLQDGPIARGDIGVDDKALQQLLELSLQLCIYTEAANLRHTPHLLCLVYHIMRSAPAFREVYNELRARTADPNAALPHTHWLYWIQYGSAQDFPIAAVLPPDKADDARPIIITRAGNASDSSSSCRPRQVVAGGCDITTLKRCVIQQLFNIAPEACKGPAATVLKKRPTAAPQQRQQQQQQQQQGGPLPPCSSSEVRGSQLRQQQEALKQTKADILTRVRQRAGGHAGDHVAFVAQLLDELLPLAPAARAGPGASDLLPTPSLWLQKQQTYLRVVVQPLFFFLAEQIDLAGQQAGEDPALRIAYDDVNECCCSPEYVDRLLTTLRQVQQQQQHPDLWSALQQALAEAAAAADQADRYPRDPKRVAVLDSLSQVLVKQRQAEAWAEREAGASEQTSFQVAAAERLNFDPANPLVVEPYALDDTYNLAKRGANWWASNLFKHKTFVEARSIASPFVAFWRVYAFHASLLTAMAALAYVWKTDGAHQGWTRWVAAMLLTAVTDAFMRAARAAAYMLLSLYTMTGVSRKVHGKTVSLNPFPAGSFKSFCMRLMQLLLWFSWACFLGLMLGLSITPAGNKGLVDALSNVAGKASARVRFAVFVSRAWMVPAAVHVLLVWGVAVLRQRHGFVIGNVWQALSAAGQWCCGRARGDRAGPGASCSSDPMIDSLFFPARNLRINASRTHRNRLLWMFVIGVKVAFEFFFVIAPLTEVVLKLVSVTSESLLKNALGLERNLQAAEIISDVFIAVTLSVPVALMSFSDTGMFFSAVGGFTSALRGVKSAVGSIKTWSDMVNCFEVLLVEYRTRCLSNSAWLPYIGGTDEQAAQEASVRAMSAGWNALALDLRQRDLLSTRELAVLLFEPLQLTHRQKGDLLKVEALQPFTLTTILPARCFMAGAVAEVAAGSVCSPHQLWVMKTVWGWLLWVLWQTGLLVPDGAKVLLQEPPDDAQEKARLMEQETAVYTDGAKTLQALAQLQLLYPARVPGQTARWQEMLKEVMALLQLLSSGGGAPSNLGPAAQQLLQSQGVSPKGEEGKRPEGLLHGVPLRQTVLREKARDLSHCLNHLVDLLKEELDAMMRNKRALHKLGVMEAQLTDLEKLLNYMSTFWGMQVADTIVDQQHAQRAPSNLQGIVPGDGLLPQHDRLEAVLEYVAKVGRKSDGPAQVVRYLSDVLEMHSTEPADGEAVRFIVTFASSLRDGELKPPPSVQECSTVSTLVPHYNEDVLYALSEDDALADLALPDTSQLTAESKREMLYLMTPEGYAEPTLSYLRSVYNTIGQQQTQWTNFVERVTSKAVAEGRIPAGSLPKAVYEHHFLPGAVLHAYKQELLLWASWRGQLLARTVRGLSSYRTALLTLAQQENPDLVSFATVQQQQQQPQVLQQPPPPPPSNAKSFIELFRSIWPVSGWKWPQQQQQQPSPAALQAGSPPQQRPQLQDELDRVRDVVHMWRTQLQQLQAKQKKDSELEAAEREALQKVQAELAGLQDQQQGHTAAKRRAELEQQQICLQELLDVREKQNNALEKLLEVTEDELKTKEAELRPLQEQAQYWQAMSSMLLEDLVDSKYHLVVSSQNLGVFASMEEREKNLKSAWLSHSVHELRLLHKPLKVAYIDKQRLLTASRPGHRVGLFRHASVLLASERSKELLEAVGLPATTQAYRVLLPINFESDRGVVLGEGKPENQNHAVVFCPGEALQTIDCNQDNIVAEGLKLRNLLQELRRPVTTDRGRHQKQVALVGFREWIFSEDSGALADFAAATERSFGTTVQRLMYNPGAVRFHYGHPDVWSRAFVSTRGGVSKPNKSQHVSEDVFGGYNVMLRGAEIKFVDYIAVGKGRDMGFETINTFEAKIAAGNGEQVLSRDVRRLAHNMDFGRLMSWYHTGNGFFINTAITMISVHASLWAYLLLALGRYSNAEVQATLSSVQLLQLGSLSLLVYLFTLTVEIGIFRALWTILRQTLQGSLMFFIFRAQTSAYSFTYDLLFGGAKYLPTGRGYKLAHTSFKDLYRRFGRSHFYFGAVLLQYAVACIAAGHAQGLSLLVLWGPLLVVLSLLFGPFWFTPFAFRTDKVTADMRAMLGWFRSPSTKPEASWTAWNAEAWEAADNKNGKGMGRIWVCLRAVLLKLPTLLLMLGAAARMKSPDMLKGVDKLPKYVLALVMAGAALVAAAVVTLLRRWQALKGLEHNWTRVFELVMVPGVAAVWLTFSLAHTEEASAGVRKVSNVALVGFGTVLLLRLLPLVHYLPWPLSGEAVRSVCSAVYYVADVILTYALIGVRFVLSVFDILTGLQAQLLFNTAYARQLMAEKTLEDSELPQLAKKALQQQHKQRIRRAAAGPAAAGTEA